LRAGDPGAAVGLPALSEPFLRPDPKSIPPPAPVLPGTPAPTPSRPSASTPSPQARTDAPAVPAPQLTLEQQRQQAAFRAAQEPPKKDRDKLASEQQAWQKDQADASRAKSVEKKSEAPKDKP